MKKGTMFASLTMMLLLSAQTLASSYYGPTVTNDRLYRIALALQPSPQVDVQQVMVGIYEYNTYAFIDNNMNGLYAGILLYIPTVEQIAQVDTSEAHVLIKKHNEAWKAIHSKLAKTKQSSNNAVTDLRSYDANEKDHVIVAEPILNNDKKSFPVDMAKEQENTSINLNDDAEDTIFTAVSERKPNDVNKISVSLDSATITTESKLNDDSKGDDADYSFAHPEEHVSTNDLQKMQQQLSEMQLQLGQILVAVKDRQHVKKDLRSSLQHKYALFDSSKLRDNSSYYSELVSDDNAAYMEWFIAAIMCIATLGLIISNKRDSYVDMGVDLDNMEDDEYDYIGSSDGIPVKLNLAKAYCEMGNHEKAKKTLAEVIQKGNKSQQIEAKDMLDEIAQNENNKK